MYLVIKLLLFIIGIIQNYTIYKINYNIINYTRNTYIYYIFYYGNTEKKNRYTLASSERSMSTLKRIKSFLRNTMTNERLTNLSSLAIEKNLLGVMAKDPTFVESIIDDFAKKKERRIELEYKII